MQREDESNGTTPQRKMKILFLNRGDSLYDEMFLKSFITSFDVTCATFNPSPSMDFMKSKLVNMSNPFMFLYKYARARYLVYSIGHRQIRNVLEQEKPDLMVCSYSATYGFMGGKSDFHPFILITFGSDVLLGPKSLLLGSRIRFALSKADLILVDGPESEKAVLRLGVDERKIVKFPRFDPIAVTRTRKEESSLSLRSRFGLGDKRIVLHTRWFEPVYNVATVVRAFALARKKIPDLALVLVGSGSLEKEVRALVEKLNLSESVHFAGRLPREELIPLYDEADVYVSACVSDSMNGSLLEAICRGIPVVVSNSETNREWIENDVSGSLANPLSPEEIADKILRVINEPEKYRQMALLAKSNVLTKIDWQKSQEMMIQKMLELARDRRTNHS